MFLVNLVGARFPSISRREQIPIPDSLIKEELPEGDYHLEEERRLFYVGMTRARDQLFLTAANFYGEGKREKSYRRLWVKRLVSMNLPQKKQKRRRYHSWIGPPVRLRDFGG